MKAQAYPASLREAEPGSATEASDDEPRVVDHIDLPAKHAQVFLARLQTLPNDILNLKWMKKICCTFIAPFLY